MQWFFSLMGFHFICCLKACRVKWWDDGLLQMFGWRQWIVWTGARSQVRSANQEIASSSSPSYCTLGNQADKLVFFFSRTSGPYAPIFSNVSLHSIVTLYKLCQGKMMIEQSKSRYKSPASIKPKSHPDPLCVPTVQWPESDLFWQIISLEPRVSTVQCRGDWNTGSLFRGWGITERSKAIYEKRRDIFICCPGPSPWS